jgi:hypothetical protein
MENQYWFHRIFWYLVLVLVITVILLGNFKFYFHILICGGDWRLLCFASRYATTEQMFYTTPTENDDCKTVSSLFASAERYI